MFGRYTPDNYDKHHYLKPPIGFYFILLMLLRPYIIWVVSVANRNDTTVLLESFYPDKYNFFTALAIGAGAVFVTFMFSLRREKAYHWVAKLWPGGLWLLWGSWLADLGHTLYLVKKIHFNFEPSFAAVLLSLFFAGLYMARSVHLKDFFNDWPQETLAQSEQGKST